MAIIKAMVGKEVISGFKGTLDYYVHDGIPCVRRWPRSPGKNRSKEVEAQWPRFRYASRLWPTLSPFVQDAYTALGRDSKLTGRDWAERAYLSGVFRYEH